MYRLIWKAWDLINIFKLQIRTCSREKKNRRLKLKYSFADVRDVAERPGPCNLHNVCVVLCRGSAKQPRKEGKRRWWEIQPQRIPSFQAQINKRSLDL